MAVDKGWEVASLRHAVLAVAKFYRLLGCVGEICFEVKKLLNGWKDLKTVRSKMKNWRKRPSLLKNVSPPPLQKKRWRQTAHRQCLLGGALLVYVALDLCYIFWLKIDFSAGRCARARCQIVALPPYSLPLNLLDSGTLYVLQLKGIATTHPKMSTLKRTVWQLRSTKDRPCYSKIAPISGRA